MRVILLEHPRPKDPERFQDVVNAPLSACLTTGYIASVLHANKIQVEIVDANLYGWSVEKTIAELHKKPFDLLGVHTVYLWDNTKSVFDMLLILRDRGVKAHINLYGFYPTFAYERLLLEYPFIDSVTIGEPELTFLELAQKMTAGLKNPQYNTDGIAYKLNNTRVIKNKPRQLIKDIDKMPFPLRYIPLTPNPLPKGRGKGEGGKDDIHTYILGSRGCYGNCTFCYINPFYGGPPQADLWRGRSPENILEEICQLHERHKINYFYFADANFFGPDKYGKERARRLAELIIRNGLKIGFGIECRANDVEEKTLSALVHAGLKQVFLGIESGSQTSLNRFKKGVSVEVNKRAIQTIRKFGIEPSLGFIMFEPYSTLTKIRANLDFLKEMNLLSTPSVTAHLLHHKETLFQGTPDYTQIFNGQGNPAPTGYETTYAFKDERVAKLFNLATHICQKALTRIRNSECGTGNNVIARGEAPKQSRSNEIASPSACNDKSGTIRNPQSVFENQSLIDSFESALGGLRDLENRDEINSWTKGTS